MKKIITKIRQKLRYTIIGFKYRARLGVFVSRGEQIALIHQYQIRKQLDCLPSSLKDVGFQQYSGTDEDGILLYLFAVVGVTNKILVDIGCASPVGSNSANLIINHQWWGLLVDGSQQAVDHTNALYRNIPNVKGHPPTVVQKFISAENVNAILLENDIVGEIDLLSIDIDGVDYWVWKAIKEINPRVVVVEYQPAVGSDASITVPYDASFDRSQHVINRNSSEIVYAGASLQAFTKLGREKGYVLVGCNTQEFNAFFVRDDVNNGVLEEVSVAECFNHTRTKYIIAKHQSRTLAMDWENV